MSGYTEVMEALKEKVRALPKAPGVYIFRGAGEEVLYVGKASSLRDRVGSGYFQSERGLAPKVRWLVQEIQDLEVITTQSEVEALILEDALIKKYRPRYNVRLRDDKRYPYLKITAEPFPRVLIVRRRVDDGSRYFGPYTSTKAMRRVLKLSHKLFPLRTCNLPLGERVYERPCLLYHIGRCSGPCAGLVSPEEYRRFVEGVALLFEGRVDGVIENLQGRMLAAAQEERFEYAAHLRDQIRSLERIRERQAVALTEPTDLDAVGVAVEGTGAGYGVVLLVRGGRLIGREGFPLTAPSGAPESEVLADFLDQYYTRATAIPQEVLLPFPVPEAEVLGGYLARRREGRVEVRVPKRGERHDLVQMAHRNAAISLHRAQAERTLPSWEEALEELAEALNLAVRPWRIEAYDISNLQGQEATGSMVTFVGGKPRPDAYRRFRVRRGGKPNDYAMMEEVLRRRLSHGLAELSDPAIARGRFSDLPDLILVDGGKGQLGVAIRALEELGLGGIEVAALAKREELVFVPGSPRAIRLPEDAKALHLLRHIRDEAHRFAVGYHRHLREHRQLWSLLDEVEGVGPKRREELLRRFGSLEGLHHASLEDLLSVPKLPRSVAEHLYKALHTS